MRSQIWIAVSVYVLIAIIKKRLNLEPSLYTLLQVLSVTVFEKMPLQQAFSDSDHVFDDAMSSTEEYRVLQPISGLATTAIVVFDPTLGKAV